MNTKRDYIVPIVCWCGRCMQQTRGTQWLRGVANTSHVHSHVLTFRSEHNIIIMSQLHTAALKLTINAVKTVLNVYSAAWCCMMRALNLRLGKLFTHTCLCHQAVLVLARHIARKGHFSKKWQFLLTSFATNEPPECHKWGTNPNFSACSARSKVVALPVIAAFNWVYADQ